MFETNFNKANSEEINFKLICPYQFHRMFRRSVGMEDDLRDLLVYEVFNCNGFNFTQFLSEELGMEDMGFIASKTDQNYLSTWKNIEGCDASRFYLYPKNDKNNRLPDRQSNSEISFIFDKIKESQEYSYESTESDDGSESYSYDIFDPYGVRMFTVRPCCPYCHTLLPDMWFSDFIKSYLPIALIAGKSGGKTTYMTSLLDRNFRQILKGMGGIIQWDVDTGIQYEEDIFKIQQTRFENLNRLINGKYPRPTDYVMPPVCIKITKMDSDGNKALGHILVSIFDCKGELYEKLGKNAATDEEMQFLNFMHSYIFLVDHFQMAGIDSFEPLMSVAEQGKFQKENAHDSITAEKILENHRDNSDNKDENLYRVLVSLKKFLSRYGNGKDLKHIAYTIVKSDELKKFPETLKRVDGMADLLKQDDGLDTFNPDNFAGVDYIVQEFFSKIVFNAKRNDSMDIMRSMGGKQVSKSWHCISVARKLPPERQTEEKERECEFYPVRIAEPFARCIREEMKRLNWL